MSFMDIAQLLGNLGEFIGAIVIVATLIYLAMQVKQNTNALHAQSRQSVVAGAQTELFAIMDNPDMVINITKEGPLTPQEQVQLQGYLTAAMRLREFSWLQYQNGVIDENLWGTEQNVILVILQSNRTRAWWELLGRSLFGPDFVGFVDELIRDQPTSNELWQATSSWADR